MSKYSSDDILKDVLASMGGPRLKGKRAGLWVRCLNPKQRLKGNSKTQSINAGCVGEREKKGGPVAKMKGWALSLEASKTPKKKEK